MLLRKGRRGPNRRSGVVLVESAIIYSVLFLLLFGLISGAIGVFRYQQVSYLAREGSRYASVHGTTYATEQNVPAATASDVYNNAIKPRAVRMQLNNLAYSVTWNTNNQPYHTVISNGQDVAVANNVSVTVSYQWKPFFLSKPVTLSSTSVSTMSY
jgi:Flp pilus assembly protein TadG